MLKHQLDEVSGYLLGSDYCEPPPKRAALSLVDANLASGVDRAVTASGLSGRASAAGNARPPALIARGANDVARRR